jgi:uncharacterized protein
MGKLLLLILVGMVALLLWKGLARRPRPGGAARTDGERMVSCSQCGVHLPISEAVEAEGRYFCSEEHRRVSKR